MCLLTAGPSHRLVQARYGVQWPAACGLTVASSEAIDKGITCVSIVQRLW
jgi:hypothetical protein